MGAMTLDLINPHGRTGMLPTQAVTPAHWALKSAQNFLLSSEFYQLDSRVGGKVGSGTEHGE